VPVVVIAQLCGIQPTLGHVPQTKSQAETAGAHPLPEMTDAMLDTAHAHETITTEGGTGAGLEIAAIDETEIETERGVLAGSAIMNVEVGQPFYM
jgi:hypothetical protein